VVKIKIFLAKYQTQADLVVEKVFWGKFPVNQIFAVGIGGFSSKKLIGQEHQKAGDRQNSSLQQLILCCLGSIFKSKLLKRVNCSHSPGSYIPINRLPADLNKLYNQPITKKLQCEFGQVIDFFAVLPNF